MSDPATPKVSSRVSPLAVIVVVILVGLAVLIMVRMHRHHLMTPGGVKAPTSAAMPRRPDVRTSATNG